MDNNFSDIPKGLYVPTQIPLDKKLWYPSTSAVNLGQSNHLAFSFYKGMRILCAEEKEVYEWRPVQTEDQTLLSEDFVYPANSPVVNGIVYENIAYNFVKILQAEDIDLSDFVLREEIEDFIILEDLTLYEAKNLSPTVEDAVSVYKETTFEEETNTKTFSFRKIKSFNLSVEVEDDVIYINTPEDINLKSFYVNSNFEGDVTDGTLSKPFKNLEDAVIAFKGSGTNSVPQYRGAGKIVLLSDVLTTNRINVNHLFIEGGGFNITYKSTTLSYWYDYDFIKTIVGSDGQGNPLESIIFKCENTNILCENIGGGIKHRTHLPVGSGSTISLTTLKSVRIEDKSYVNFLSQYSNALDNLNQPIYMYGEQVKVETTSDSDIPLILTTGLNSGGQGTLLLENISLVGSRNTLLEADNTTLVLDGITNVNYNIYWLSLKAKNAGKYTAKLNKNFFNILGGTYFRVANLEERQTYPIDNQNLSPICIADSIFKVISPTSGIPLTARKSTVLVLNGILQGIRTNNLVKASKDSGVELTNIFSLASTDFTVGAFVLDTTYTSVKSTLDIGVEGSVLRGVKTVAGISVYASSAIVNNSIFSKGNSFANDSEAISSGLIAGNLYYNTTISSMTKIL